MKKIKSVFLALLVTTPLLAKEAGNGNAGFCFAEKCTTLAKAGLIVDPEFRASTYDISWELSKKVEEIIGALPLHEEDKRRLLSYSLAQKGTFLPVLEVDQKKYQSALKSYKEIYKTKAPDEVDDIILLAISDRKLSDKELQRRKRKGQNLFSRTYLLPEFFKSDLETQALTLIHEAFVRERPADVLQAALEFDGLVHKYLYEKNNFDAIVFYYVFNERFRTRYYEKYILREIFTLNGGQFNWEALCKNDVPKEGDFDYCYAGRSNLLGISRLHPLLGQMLNRISIKNRDLGIWQALDLSIYESIYDAFSIVSDNRNIGFRDNIEKYKEVFERRHLEYSMDSDYVARIVINFCYAQDPKGEDVFFTFMDTKDDGEDGPVYIDCRVGKLRIKPVSYYELDLNQIR